MNKNLDFNRKLTASYAHVQKATKEVHFTITPIEQPIAEWRLARKAIQAANKAKSHAAYLARRAAIIDLWLAKERAVIEADVESQHIDLKANYIRWVEKQKAGKPQATSACSNHKWNTYIGFTATYEYCEVCDAKKSM